MTTIVDVTITAPDTDWLLDHVRNLVEQRLAASGNVIPAIRSVYRWKGTVEDATEAYAVLHTRADLVPAIVKATNAAHPYETVHVLAKEILDADPDYRQWIIDETAPVDAGRGVSSG